MLDGRLLLFRLAYGEKKAIVSGEDNNSVPLEFTLIIPKGHTLAIN